MKMKASFTLKQKDWDLDAFLAVLNVRTLQNKEVPKALSLEGLANMALIADCYDPQRASEAKVSIWMRVFEDPTNLKEYVLWIRSPGPFNWQIILRRIRNLLLRTAHMRVCRQADCLSRTKSVVRFTFLIDE
jgi:hypothetical protein